MNIIKNTNIFNHLTQGLNLDKKPSIIESEKSVQTNTSSQSPSKNSLNMAFLEPIKKKIQSQFYTQKPKREGDELLRKSHDSNKNVIPPGMSSLARALLEARDRKQKQYEKLI